MSYSKDVKSDEDSVYIPVYHHKIELSPVKMAIIKECYDDISIYIQARNMVKLTEIMYKLRMNNIECKEMVFPGGHSPIMYAAAVAAPEFIQYFINLGGDCHLISKTSGLTSLLTVCKCTHSNKYIEFEQHHDNVYKCVQILLENGVDIHSKLFKEGDSALHLAASNNYYKLIELFVGKMSVDVLNRKKYTPLMIAASLGHIEMVKLLEQAGSDVKLKNSEGFTAFDLAVMNRHYELADFMKINKGPSNSNQACSSVPEGLKDENTDNLSGKMLDSSGDTPSFLSHLEPILREKNLSFADLKSMNDSELYKIGIRQYNDRKSVIYPDVDGDISEAMNYNPRPVEIYNFVNNVVKQFDFIQTTVEYMRIQMNTELDDDSTIEMLGSEGETLNDSIKQYERICQSAQLIRQSMKQLDILFENVKMHVLPEDDHVDWREKDVSEKQDA